VKFAQTIEFTSSRVAEFHHYLDAWIARTEGDRIAHRAVLTKDRDGKDRYILTVVFASHHQAWRTPTAPLPRSLPRS
jgi:hypothetical protein